MDGYVYLKVGVKEKEKALHKEMHVIGEAKRDQVDLVEQEQKSKVSLMVTQAARCK